MRDGAVLFPRASRVTGYLAELRSSGRLASAAPGWFRFSCDVDGSGMTA
jgi:hypothetical protein